MNGMEALNYQGKKEEESGRTNRENANKKVTGGGSGHDVKDIPHDKPPAGSNPDGIMGGPLMTWTKMLENLDAVSDGIESISEDPMNASLDGPMDSTEDSTPHMGIGSNDDELLDELNQIFTPILIMQGFEGDIADRIQEACSEDNVLLERNIIKFDDATRMAQLISVCALLIARQKNTEQYQTYKKASQIRNSMKLEIQKQEYAAAQTLAQKFLVKVSTTNNSSIARQSAQNLLPETQH